LSDETNNIDIKVTSSLDNLGIKKPSFVSSIKELKEKGLIEILKYDGRSYKIRIALNDDDIASLIKEKIQETLF
jgi:DNA-binding transcriptional ArsR family regulator